MNDWGIGLSGLTPFYVSYLANPFGSLEAQDYREFATGRNVHPLKITGYSVVFRSLPPKAIANIASNPAAITKVETGRADAKIVASMEEEIRKGGENHPFLAEGGDFSFVPV